MINYHSSLVSALKGVAPVYYEKFDGVKQLPCITYLEISNVDHLVGDTQSYSYIDFQIKVWAKTTAETVVISAQIDKIMKPLGFRRSFSTEMVDNNLIVKVMRYSGLGRELEV